MTDKNFDFNNTRDALSQLSTDLLQLESAIKLKRSQLAENNKKNSEQLEKQEKIIASLTKVSEDALVKIDNITDFIDGVL